MSYVENVTEGRSGMEMDKALHSKAMEEARAYLAQEDISAEGLTARHFMEWEIDETLRRVFSEGFHRGFEYAGGKAAE
jgi:hypothetical protein